MKHIEFINYTGKYPNLCSGILTLKIDGETVTFGSKYRKPTPMYEKFWSSGGNCGFSNNYSDTYIEEGRWIIDTTNIPAQYQKYANEINEVFNDNVEYGCCGGCL